MVPSPMNSRSDPPPADGSADYPVGTMDEGDAVDRIAAMLAKEERYLCHDYLGARPASASGPGPRPPAAGGDGGGGPPVDETCRSRMCEWIFHVVDSTRLRRETAALAMGYLDRFLCSSSARAASVLADRREYQLAAMTCLYLSVKLHEPFEMDAGLMSRLSRGVHAAAEITSMEWDILLGLGWEVNGPTPAQFVGHILELLPEGARDAGPALYEHSHFQTELAVGDYTFVPHLRPSSVAVAAILNSLGGIERGCAAFNECVLFVRRISDAFGLDIDSPLIDAVRERLLQSFAKSSGYELSPGPTPIPKQVVPLKDKVNKFEESPTCVLKEMAFSLGD